MARRRRRRFGSPAAEHEVRKRHAYDRMEENIERAIRSADDGACKIAVGALATAEYWRGRGDSDAEGAGDRDRSRPARIGRAYEAVSKCKVR